MKVPENLMEYVKSQCEKISYGKVIIEVIEHSKTIDVVTEERQRFDKQEPKNPNYNNG